MWGQRGKTQGWWTRGILRSRHLAEREEAPRERERCWMCKHHWFFCGLMHTDTEKSKVNNDYTIIVLLKSVDYYKAERYHILSLEKSFSTRAAWRGKSDTKCFILGELLENMEPKAGSPKITMMSKHEQWFSTPAAC